MSLVFNADTLKIASHLRDNPEARAQVVEMATTYAARAEEMSGENGDQDAQELMDSVKNIIENEIQPATGVLGLGWEGGFRAGINATFSGPLSWGGLGIQIFGWLITTLALSLGSPFWFDILNRAMNLRGASKAVRKKIEDVRYTK